MPNLSIVVGVLLLATCVGALAHEDGPGAHTAEKHDTMAVFAEIYIENTDEGREICKRNLTVWWEEKTKFMQKNSGNPSPSWHAARIHAGAAEAQKRCRLLFGTD